MENFLSTEVILAAMSALGGGVAWLVKRYFDKKDEEQKRIFAERDADKQAIKNDINDLKADLKDTKKRVTTMQSIIIGCKHEDCPSRELLAQMLKQENNQ